MHFFTTLALVTGAIALDYPGQQVPIGSTGGPTRYSVKTPPLDTEWTYAVGKDPWPMYPRPKLARSQWQSLNGIWTYSNASSHHALKKPPFNKTLSHEVLVPYCLESGLSGIQGENTIYSWYRTTFNVPEDWDGDRVLLNFGAVDYEATVFVNGKNATFHRGGFSAFSVDVTKYLKDGDNELIVFAFDPTDMEDYVIPIGKQTLYPSHIFYRPCSGIWQSVWIESAPKNHISDLSINGDADGHLNVTVKATGKKSKVEIAVYDRETSKKVGSHSGTTGSQISFKVSSPKKWSPDSPTLYDVTIKMDEDEIKSYTAFRTVTRKKLHGVHRVVLNDEAIFTFGTLDQGYWPDGLFTPPTYDAMTYDIKTLKRIGYNMLRKHIKVEPALYYAAADELGILIMQDMPALRPQNIPAISASGVSTLELPDKAEQKEWERQIKIIIDQFKNYASIFAWVIYNEGWGQLNDDYQPEFDISKAILSQDSTRLINAVSGWNDHGAGDFSDNHHYSDPQCGVPWNSFRTSEFDDSRIGFQGEFGGTGHNVSAAHLWKVEKAIKEIDQTYELHKTLHAWNFRGHIILTELLSQVELYSCAGAVWTQTTDVEGEINGMMTYDRRIVRTDFEQWNRDIQALYDSSARRSNGSVPVATRWSNVL